MNRLRASDLPIQIPCAEVASVPQKHTSCLMKIKFDPARFGFGIEFSYPFPAKWAPDVARRHFISDVYAIHEPRIEIVAERDRIGEQKTSRCRSGASGNGGRRFSVIARVSLEAPNIRSAGIKLFF